MSAGEGNDCVGEGNFSHLREHVSLALQVFSSDCVNGDLVLGSESCYSGGEVRRRLHVVCRHHLELDSHCR